MKYPEYEATQFARNQILQFDFMDQDVPGKEYIETLENASPFADKLRERACALGYSGDLTDVKSLRSFLFQLLKKEQGIIDENNARVWKANLTNWLVPQKENPAPVMPGKREAVYQLCFALQMNAHEAGEFFVKGYLERPFNFKDLRETVYFYCLNNGLSYSEAVTLFQTAQAVPFEKNTFAETNTAAIGYMVKESQNTDAFLDYIRLNRWSFETGSITAKNRITQLIVQCLPYATKEHNTFNFSERLEAVAERDERVEKVSGATNYKIRKVTEENISNEEALLSVIYGYFAREERVVNGKKTNIYNRTLSKDSLFPKLIRERMVAHATHLSTIQKGTAPDTTTRSALILFDFYHFFSSARENGYTDTSELFEEFVDEVDALLLECGYGQLYWRNPYDWMIGYCAKAWDPIDQLRFLIDEFFLDDETVIH